MDIICQELPDANELLRASGRNKRLVCEPDTYAHFLELFEREIDDFILKRSGLSSPPNEAGVGSFLDWQRVRNQHIKAFNKDRAKYHLYHGQVYGYNPMIGNVGHEVEAFRLDPMETVALLNKRSLQRRTVADKVKGFVKSFLAT